MNGYSHALSGGAASTAGLAAWVATGHTVNLPAAAAWTLTAAGAAMLNDTDTTESTIAYTYGPVTYSLCRIIHWLSGGHRQRTHTLLFCLAAGAAAQLAGGWLWGRVAVLTLMIGFALRVFRVDLAAGHLRLPGASRRTWFGRALRWVFRGRRGRLFIHRFIEWDWYTAAGNAAVTGATVWWLETHTGADLGRGLGVAVFTGTLMHCLGDMLTPQRVPFWWIPGLVPLENRYGVEVIAHTDNWAENLIVVPILTCTFLGCGWYTTVHVLDTPPGGVPAAVTTNRPGGPIPS